MAVWSSRTSGYKLGVLVLFLASGFYLLGYAAPFWIQYGSRSYYGLWLSCSKSYFSGIDCFSVTRGDLASWFKATQAMECLGLIGVFISCVYALVVNCCQSAPSHNRLLEIMCGSSGLTGFIGCMIFVGKTEKYLSNLYGWAFGLNLTGCILLIITAVIICVTNRADLPMQSGGTVVSYAGGVPPQGMNTVVVQQGQAYPAAPQGYPAQPGYVAQPGYGYSGAPQYPGYVPAAPPQAGYPPSGYSAYNYPQGYSAQAPPPEPKK